jgi:hypothetical protein
VCAQCAKDSGMGIVCSPSCESEVKAVHALVERNKKMYVLAPKTHSRQALFLTLMAVVFVGFGYFSEFRFMSAYLIIFGVVLLCGAAFSVLNSRRIAKITSSDRA